MPGLLKIGYTERAVEVRMRELSFGSSDTCSTGVPMPFELVKQWRIVAGETRKIEQLLHAHLIEHRLPAATGSRTQKEFFRLDELTAITLVDAKLADLGLLALAVAHEKQVAIEADRLRMRRAAEKERVRQLAACASEVHIAKQEAIQRVKSRFELDDKSRAMRIALATFVGGVLLLALFENHKIGAYVFAVLVAAMAYFFNLGGTSQKHLGSPEFLRELADIEASIRGNYGPAVEPPIAVPPATVLPTTAPTSKLVPRPAIVASPPAAPSTGQVHLRCPNCWARGRYAATVNSAVRLSCRNCRWEFLPSEAIKAG